MNSSCMYKTTPQQRPPLYKGQNIVPQRCPLYRGSTVVVFIMQRCTSLETRPIKIRPGLYCMGNRLGFKASVAPASQSAGEPVWGHICVNMNLAATMQPYSTVGHMHYNSGCNEEVIPVTHTIIMETLLLVNLAALYRAWPVYMVTMI